MTKPIPAPKKWARVQHRARTIEALPGVSSSDGVRVYVTLHTCRCGATRALVALHFKSSRRSATAWSWARCT